MDILISIIFSILTLVNNISTIKEKKKDNRTNRGWKVKLQDIALLFDSNLPQRNNLICFGFTNLYPQATQKCFTVPCIIILTVKWQACITSTIFWNELYSYIVQHHIWCIFCHAVIRSKLFIEVVTFP